MSHFRSACGCLRLECPLRPRIGIAAEQRQQVIAIVVLPALRRGVQRGFNFLGRISGRHKVSNFRALLIGVVDIEEHRGVAQFLGRLLVFPFENFQDAQVAPDLIGGGFREEVDDLRLMFLTVSVHASVALLEYHQRPGQVEMHDPMAKVVEVQTLAGDVRA